MPTEVSYIYKSSVQNAPAKTKNHRSRREMLIMMFSFKKQNMYQYIKVINRHILLIKKYLIIIAHQ